MTKFMKRIICTKILFLIFTISAYGKLNIEHIEPTIGIIGEPVSITIHGNDFNRNTRVLLSMNGTGNNIELSSISLPGEPGKLFIKKDMAYISLEEGGLVVVDVNNPYLPELKGKVKTSGYGDKLIVKDNKAFLLEYYEDLQLIDIFDPLLPEWEGTLCKDVRGMDIQDNYLYITTEENLLIMDITDPLQPDFIGFLNNLNEASNINVQGNIAYIIESGTILLVDISKPKAPHKIAYLDVALNPRGEISFYKDIAFVKDYGEYFTGFFMVDVSESDAPKFMNYTDFSNILIKNNLLYDLKSYILDVWDIKNVDSFKKIKSIVLNDYFDHIEVNNEIGYLINNKGFHMISVPAEIYAEAIVNQSCIQLNIPPLKTYGNYSITIFNEEESYVLEDAITISERLPEIWAYPQELNFESIDTYKPSSHQSVSLSNLSDHNIDFGTAIIEGSSDFSIYTDTCSNKTISKSESCTVHIGFLPESDSFSQAIINVPVHQSDISEKRISLNGLLSKEKNYIFDRLWPIVSFKWDFRSIYDLTVDSEGFVYVTDSQIKKFTPYGQLIQQWGDEYFLGIATDRQNNVYSVAKGFIHKYNTNGKFISRWGIKGVKNSEYYDPSFLPNRIAVKDNIIYVTDLQNCRVVMFNTEGNYLREWGSRGSEDGQFLSFEGIAIDDDGFVYIIDSTNKRIQKFTNNGEFHSKWGSRGFGEGQFINPSDIEIYNNEIYVLEYLRIQVFNLNGNFHYSFVNRGNRGLGIHPDGWIFASHSNKINKYFLNGEKMQEWGVKGSSLNGEFNYPTEVVVDDNDNIYVLDPQNYRIQKFNSKGKFITKLGRYGEENDCFLNPTAMAIDSDSKIYVIDNSLKCLKKFDSEGNFIDQWALDTSYYPTGIDVDSYGNIYILDDDIVYKYDQHGNLVNKWGGYGKKDGLLSGSSKIAIDNDNNVYITDKSNYRIQKFTSEGMFLKKWGTKGAGNGEFQYLNCMTIDHNNFIYVSEADNNRIQKFTPNGEFIMSLGSTGNHSGLFNNPNGLCVNSTGQLFVVDTNNHRLQSFQPYKETYELFKAIIVAGASEGIETSVSGNINYANTILLQKGFTKETIYVLDSYQSINRFFNYAVTSEANLEYAITEWASDADHLLFYFVGHGLPEMFSINNSLYLPIKTLNQWLNQAYETIDGDLIVIYEACFSGSFIQAENRIPGKNKVYITSTNGIKSAIMNENRNFTFSLWGKIQSGYSLGEAFQEVQIAMDYAKYQVPLMDADGIFNNTTFLTDSDIEISYKIYIGNSIDTVVEAPVHISPDQIISEGNSASFYATLTKNEQTINVWGEVALPENDNLLVTLTKMNRFDFLWSEENQRYEAVFDGFNSPGEYTIYIYKQNRNDVNKQIGTTRVTIENPNKHKAIIIAGVSKHMEPIIQNLVSKIYKALSFQQYSDDDIMIIASQDSSIPDVPIELFKEANIQNIDYAINEWSKTNLKDLSIIMLGVGTKDKFYIDYHENIFLSNKELDSWIDKINVPVRIIYDGGCSMQFLNEIKPPEGNNLLLISSSSSAAFFLSNGDISFSKYFWDSIFLSGNSNRAYEITKNSVQGVTLSEQQVFKKSYGSLNWDNDIIGSGIGKADSNNIIIETSYAETIYTQTSVVITVKANEVTEKVWGVDFSSDYSEEYTNTVIQTTSFILEKKENNIFEGRYYGCIDYKTYNIALLAMTKSKAVSLPQIIQIKKELPVNNFMLSINTKGTGTVEIKPYGITCSSICHEEFNEYSQITLSASTNSDWEFTGWEGDCSGAEPCTLTMNRNKNITAVFKDRYRIEPDKGVINKDIIISVSGERFDDNVRVLFEKNVTNKIIKQMEFDSFVWDYSIENNYIYLLINRTGLKALDITNPLEPVDCGQIEINNNRNLRAIEVVNGKAYVIHGSSTKDSKLQLVDLSKPTAMKILGNVELPDMPDDIFVSKNSAYIIVNNQLFIIDIKNENNPTITDTIDFSEDIKFIKILENKAYIVAGNELNIYSVEEDCSITKITSYELNYKSEYELTGMYITDTQAYFTWGKISTNDGAFVVIDILSDSDPEMITSLNTSGFVRDIYIQGTCAYLACDLNGIRIIDINNPDSPKLLTTIQTNQDTPAYKVKIYNNIAYVSSSYKNFCMITVPTYLQPDIIDEKTLNLTIPGPALTGEYNIVIQYPDKNEFIEKMMFLPQSIFLHASVYPKSLDFYQVSPNVTSPYQLITISNTKESDLTFGSLSLTGNNNTSFKIETDSCSNRILSATEFCSVNVTFKPEKTGDHFAELLIPLSNQEESISYVPLTGKGYLSLNLNSIIPNHSSVSCSTRYTISGSGFDDSTQVKIYRNNWEDDSLISQVDWLEGWVIEVSGNQAFLIDRKGIHIVNVENPEQPRLSGTIKTPTTVYNLEVIDNIIYAAGSSNGLLIYDVKTPENPIIMAQLDLPGTARDVEVSNNNAYIASTSGLHIIDVTNLSEPHLITTIFSTKNIFCVKVVNNFAYLGIFGNDLKIIDIIDPYNPIMEGSFESNIKITFNDIEIVNNIFYGVYIEEYLGSDLENGLYIIDVNKPSSPELISKLLFSDRPGSLSLTKNKAYLAASEGIHIVDIQDIDNPKVIKTIQDINSPSSIEVVNDIIYAVNGKLNIIYLPMNIKPEVINDNKISFSLPEGMVPDIYNVRVFTSSLYETMLDALSLYDEKIMLSSFIKPESKDFGITDINSVSPFQLFTIMNKANEPIKITPFSIIGDNKTLFHIDNDKCSDNVLTPLSQCDFQIHFFPETSGAKTASLLFQLEDSSSSLDIPLKGWGFEELKIESFKYKKGINEPIKFYMNGSGVNKDTKIFMTYSQDNSKPWIGIYDTHGFANSVEVFDNVAFVADLEKGLQIIDVSDLTQPELISCYTMVNAFSVKVKNSIAYITDLDKGLVLIDISELSNPYLITSVSTPGQPNDVVLSDDRLYIADGSKGISRFNIENSKRPIFIDSIQTSNYARHVIINNQHAYVADTGGLNIVNLQSEYITDLLSYTYDISINFPYLYITDITGLKIINVTDPYYPLMKGSIDTQGSTGSIFTNNDIAFIVDRDQKVILADISNPYAPEIFFSIDLSNIIDIKDITYSNKFIYVAAGQKGLVIIPEPTRISNLTVIDESTISGTLPEVIMPGNYKIFVQNLIERIMLKEIVNVSTFGDFDNNGTIDLRDAIICLRILSGYQTDKIEN